MNSIAQKNIDLLFTNRIIYKGSEIGESILPELVNRASLSPIIEGNTIVQNQYYTLHNDAGQCVYISPALNEYMTKRWRRWRNGGGDGGKKWYLLPLAAPAHPYFGGGRRRGRYWEEDISHWYENSSDPLPLAQNKRGWKNTQVVRAVSAWENSALEKYIIPLPRCKDCTAMFKDCKNLKTFDGTSFKQCRRAMCMFENCTSLRELKCSRAAFYKKKGNKIIGLIYGAKMFKGSGLQAVDLDLLALKDGQQMFRDCVDLERVNMKLLRLRNMNRMFQNCPILGEVRFPHTKSQFQNVRCNLPNVVTAIGAFYNCLELVDFGATIMPKLEDGSHMFQNCRELAQIETDFPALINGEQMYDGCSSLTQFAEYTNTLFPELINARRMFKNCSELFFTDISDASFPKLEDGFATFEGCSKITSIPCKFLNVRCARQMFFKTNISGHLDLDMPTYFPNVSTSSISGGEYPVAYMFGSCPITSINFDVSSLDNGISMFNGCTSLTTCTGAVFKTGGNYQNMLDHARFDITSADIILQAAISAKVFALHIGMDSTYKTDEFKSTYGFTNLLDADDNPVENQWITNVTDNGETVGTIVVVWN